MENIKVSWSWYDILINEIYHHYKHTPPEAVVGLIRGGLIPAVQLSHLFNCPMIALQWQTRDGNDKDGDTLVEIRRNYPNALFIDDICDSGKTINQIKKIHPTSKWTTLISKSATHVDYSPVYLDSNESRWVLFPWENN